MTKERLFVLLAYFLLAFVAYRNCFDIFIPADNYSCLSLFETEGASGILKNARESAPYVITYPILYLLYQIFGIDPACWMITGILFHALFAYIVYLFAHRFMRLFHGNVNTAFTICSGLLFLISPYQTEVVLWTSVNIRLLFHACVTFLGLYLFLQYLSSSSRTQLFIIHLLFLFGVLSNEFTWICPLIYAVIFFAAMKLKKTSLKPRGFAFNFLVPQLFLISFYFMVSLLISGRWFWHAGSFSEALQTDDYLKTLLKYFLKFFLFYRYLPLGELEGLLRIFSQNKWLMFLSGSVILALAAIVFGRVIKKDPQTGYTLAAMFACMLISLVPVLPLDSSFLNQIYPDRYGYLASVFFYIFLVQAAYVVLKKFAPPFLIAYAVLCWILLARTIPVWIATNDHCNALVQNFRPFSRFENIYVLNVPAYYKGVAAFRSAFAETVFMKNNSPAQNIRVISGCYQESATDTVLSVLIEKNTVIVSGPDLDSPYFSTDAGWARSYETDEYNVFFDPGGCSYTLRFKHEIPANSTFIWTSGNKWKNVP